MPKVSIFELWSFASFYIEIYTIWGVAFPISFLKIQINNAFQPEKSQLEMIDKKKLSEKPLNL